MNIRHVAVAATLLTVALATTGCGPDDTPGTGATTTQAAPPPAAASSAAPAAPAAGQAVSASEEAAFEKAFHDSKNCATFFKAHKVLLANSAGPGQLKAVKVRTDCTQYGLTLDTSADGSVLKVAANATVVVLTKPTSGKDFPKYEAKKVSFEEFTRANKPCFDIPDPDRRPAGLICEPFFEYTVDAGGAVTSMHQTWEDQG
ncbi:hypothetical protein [Kitasatospora terrestris]|uniref:Lipoprotein n=1 Tax=Kitasatospora terrestris TaxID=258051 RepID=A0ABP9DUE6_9ACTN